MHEEKIAKLRELKEKLLYLIGIETIKEESNKKEIKGLALHCVKKEITIKGDSFWKKFAYVIGLLEMKDLLVPDYLLDKNGTISTEIKYDLVPEDKRELVASLGPVYMETYKEGKREFIRPVSLEELDLEHVIKERDFGHQKIEWEVYDKEFLSKLLAIKNKDNNEEVNNHIK